MKLLSILCLAAIGAKAHWTDNQNDASFLMKYDADTEAKLADEREANGKAIADNQDSEAELFKSINVLLTQLESHIGDEKDVATAEANGERNTNSNNKKSENEAAAKEQKDAMDILFEAVKTTTKANDDARAVHATAEKRLAKATAEKSRADKQKAIAKSSFELRTGEADKLEEKCHTASSTQLARIHAAVDKQVTEDVAYLNEGRAIIKDVTDLLTQTTEGTGAGVGSRFPSMLSLEQRLAVKELQMRYVAENRGSESADNIFQLLNIISKSIDDEEKAVHAKAKNDKEAATAVASDEKTKCTDQKKATHKFFGDLLAKANTRQVAADAEFELATKDEADTRAEEAKTDAAQKAAEDNLSTQTPILQAARDLRDDNEQKRFDDENARIAKKEQDAHAYLNGEIATIGSIRTVIAGVGGAKAGAYALVQVTNRMVRSFLGKYVTDLSKYSNLKDQITDILKAAEDKANADKIAADARKTGLDKQNDALRKELEVGADGRLEATETEQQKLVDDAQAVHDEKLDKLNKAKINSGEALSKKKAQKIVLDAAEAERARVLPILAETKVNSEADADKTFGRDNGFATSKRDASLKYLNEETAVVNEIRTALEGLNKPVGELLQDSSVTEFQRSSLIQLVQLAGKYDNTARAGYEGSAHTQKERIENLLQEIEQKLADEKKKVGETFDADTKEIQDDKDSAYASAKKIHDDGVAEQNSFVDTEQKEFDRLCGEYAARVGEQKVAQGEYDDAAGKLSAAQETQKTKVAAAKAERLDDYAQAKKFFEERADTINSETLAEKARLDNTILAVQKVGTLVANMKFTASLIQRYDEDRKSYRDTNTSDLAGRVLTLIDSLADQCDVELDRCSNEFLKDTNANAAEKISRDEEAKKIAAGQIKDLQNAVDTARAESKKAGEELKKATVEHLDISLKHNQDMDDRATAEKIQQLNIPTFEADFEQTKALAADVFDEEREIIDGKAATAQFYLTEEMTHLKAISNMLSELNILTTFNPHSIGQDGYGSRPDFSIENNAANWKNRHSKDYQRKRDEGENTDTVSLDIKDHELTVARGEVQHYDENGEEVLLQEPKDKDIKATSSVGAAIKEIFGWVKKEALYNKGRHEKETEAARTRSKNLVLHAKKIMDALKAKDENRRAVAQKIEDQSGAQLKVASTVKDAAQVDNTAKAAILADALATQAEYTPKVEKMLKDSLAENVDANDKAAANIKAKSEECKAFLNEEKNLLAVVRAKVEAKLGLEGKAALVAVVSKMASRSLARLSRYDFNVKKGQSFEDKQSGEYMTNGPTEKYEAGVTKLSDLIAQIRAKDEALLLEVAKKYTIEEGEFDAERNTEIARSKKELKDLLAKLAGIVEAARGERDVAEANRAAQEKVKDDAEADYESKNNALKAAKLLEADEVAAGNQLSTNEIAAANGAFASEKGQYDDLLKTGSALLDKEVVLIGKISSALEGKGFSLKDKPVHAKVNFCTAEKSAADSAGAKLAVIAQDCGKFNILKAGGDEASASDDEKSACDALPAAKAESSEATDKYQACISSAASFLSTGEAEAALMQLGQKYIGKDFDYEGAKAALQIQLKDILAKLTAERNSLSDQYNADVGSSTKKRDDEITRSKKVLSDLIAKHEALVAAAQKLHDDALIVQTTEQALYAKLLGIRNDKQAKFDAALTKQQVEGDQGKIDNQNNIDAANNRYVSNAARILDIKEADTDYLNEELVTIGIVEDVLATLGITDEVTTDV